MARFPEEVLGGGEMVPLVDHLSDGLFIVDRDRRILLFNAAAQRITGVESDDALGRTCHEIFTGSGSGVECAMTKKRPCTIRTVFKTGRARRADEAVVTFPMGQKKILSLNAVPLFDRSDDVVRVAVVMQDVSELHDLQQELEERYEFHNIIGKNHRMQQVFRLIEQTAGTDATVLIEGESGTGKELVARAIHFHSARAKRPFVQVNCGALVETLLESELFGHVRGAFTGAVRDKVGRFEAAEGGTVFLDEIGDVSPAVQVKLLRVIQERQFERVGENKSRTADVRIIAATNRRLKPLMEQGAFREDLYYRLRVVPIALPPLRERREDIPLLVSAFVERFAEKTGKPIRAVSSPAMARLMDYRWPGNVRELENAIEHAFVRCSGTEIRADDLPVEVREGADDRAPTSDAQPVEPSEPTPGVRQLRPGKDDQREIIEAALEATGGSRAEAARRLGVGRTTLWRRMKELGLS